MPQGRAAHFGAGAVLVAVKRQKVAALFYRKAKPPRPGDETQVVDVPVSIIAKAIVAAKWGDEADILIIANGLGWQTRTLRFRANDHYPASRSRVLRRSALAMTDTDRSEERRVGNECVSTR